ncbi:carboxylate--amine ligase [Actinomycetospora aeridis]|uniref:ATP-grasp domain-containing protein n=1 Tax=Actinomycetospora aeridis TaxID=3129231 RepID=A0ABU8N6T4_9PSEU
MTPPGVVLLGGDTNALAIARSLGPRGIPVTTLGADDFVGRSRFARAVPGVPADATAWAEHLLGTAATPLHGSVLLATSDTGITVLLRHREALAERFVLDACEPTAQAAMLDKLATYEAARAAGVPTPRFWRVDTPDDLERVRDELVYPLIVKPLFSHEYQRLFAGRGKFRSVGDPAGLDGAYGDLARAGLSVMLVEKIPGDDDRLCSYTTYVDASGRPTVDYTKRMVRRRPPGEGLGCYHLTDHVPGVRDAALRLLTGVGLRGPAAVEFMHDERDGVLKLIECNARFSAALPLMVAAGLDLPYHVYRRALGLPHELPDRYRLGRRLLHPTDDLRSFLALRRAGRMDAAAWLASLAHRQTFPVWSPRDPAPALARALARAARALPTTRPSRVTA